MFLAAQLIALIYIYQILWFNVSKHLLFAKWTF
ncbi:Uncharacterised protein [Segatella copri]|nr:Uncharacterised protein [Segatella copri]